jgi:2-methylisocitrate lyase-like PEP mutase family enzyme
MSSLKATNAAAKAFKALHVSGKPVLLANVYDATSARIVGALPKAKALATASWAVAVTNGSTDETLTLATQLKALRPIAEVAHELGKPLSVDLQDGYEDELEGAIREIIALGAVGINLEDTNHKVAGELMDVEVAADRVRRVLSAAKKEGVEDFVVNARSDAWWYGRPIEETIARGKRYLEAGATTIFVFQPKGYKPEEVTALVKAFDGKVNVGAGSGVVAHGKKATGLGVAKLAELGVARLSIGPALYSIAAQAIKEAAEAYLD